MRLPTDMTAIIASKRYRVDGATVLASDAYWDGHSWERKGRNTHLCRTPKGNYFAVHFTQWPGERNRIEPLDREGALSLYEDLPERELEPEEAFPGLSIEEA